MSTLTMNAYRKVEKKWKKLKIADEKELYDCDSGTCIPEAEDLLDCANLSSRQSWFQRVGDCELSPGWRRPIYSFMNPMSTDYDTHLHSGFYVIPGALDDANQRLLAEHCLTLYPEDPHTTNLHPLRQQVISFLSVLLSYILLDRAHLVKISGCQRGQRSRSNGKASLGSFRFSL
jgi:hypothetical protein